MRVTLETAKILQLEFRKVLKPLYDREPMKGCQYVRKMIYICRDTCSSNMSHLKTEFWEFWDVPDLCDAVTTFHPSPERSHVAGTRTG